MVFQNYALYPHMTVYDNMAFGLKLRKYPKQEIKQRVMEAAEILGIKEFLDRKPKALSGGQRQRVAVGRAIVRKPKVFLFDEPLSNLDAKLRVQMRTEIIKLHDRLQATMIYVTHDQVEAMTMGDRIVVLRDGKVQQIDTPLNLYNQPVNKFVAGFIGSPSMNFLDVRLTKDADGHLVLDEGHFKISVPKTLEPKLVSYVGKEVIFGIRPEDIYDEQTAVNVKEPARVQAQVEVVELMGSEVYLYLTTEKNHLVARIESDFFPKAGDTAQLIFDMRRVHFFDKQTEETIV
jgi:multiple sugar transport system ATP-binding protein